MTATQHGHRFSQEQVAQFTADGFLFVPQLYDAEEMDLLTSIAKADKAMKDESHVVPDAKGGQSRLNLKVDLEQDIYSAFVHSSRIVEPIEQLLGGPVYHWHHKMMLKEPHVGGAWEWHQDYGYWYHDNCLAPDLASCMIAVDRASRQNGCLQVLRGSHRLGRIDHGPSGGQVGANLKRVEAAMKRLELVYCEMQPGTALFFHSNLLHRSDQNRSPHSRWSLICCYNAMNNIPYEGPGHGEPVPLEKWDGDSIKQIGRRQLEAMAKS